MKKYLNNNEMNDLLYAYHLADTSKKTVEGWTSRCNMTKNEAKYLRTAITYTQKFINEVLNRLDNKEKDKVLKRTIKASNKPIIILDEWMKQRILGPLESEHKIVKIERTKFEKVAILAMKTTCEDCTEHFSQCSLYDIFEESLLPRAEINKNCPYSFLSDKEKAIREEMIKKLEEDKKRIREKKSKRKNRKNKNRFDKKIYKWERKGKKKKNTSDNGSVTTYKLSKKEMDEYLKDIDTREVKYRKAENKGRFSLEG